MNESEEKNTDIMLSALNRIYELDVAHSREYQMIAAFALDRVDSRLPKMKEKVKLTIIPSDE